MRRRFNPSGYQGSKSDAEDEEEIEKLVARRGPKPEWKEQELWAAGHKSATNAKRVEKVGKLSYHDVVHGSGYSAADIAAKRLMEDEARGHDLLHQKPTKDAILLAGKASLESQFSTEQAAIGKEIAARRAKRQDRKKVE